MSILKVAKDAAGIAGNIFAFGLFVSPIPTFRRIIRNGSTEMFSGLPYIYSLLNFLICMWYATPLISHDNLLLMIVTSIGAVFQFVYTIIFLMFAEKEKKVRMLGLLLVVLGVFAAILIGSLEIEDIVVRRMFVGFVSCASLISMFASPLFIIKLVIQTKSVEFMPFYLSLAAFLFTTSFFVYGMLSDDVFIYVMPIAAFLISKLLYLPSHYAVGLILVGCCPGGTASNIVTYLARGNVALSVIMTAASTLSAVILTPFLTAKLAGKYVAVDAAGLLISTLQVVVLPVLAGAFLVQYFQPFVKFVSPLMPPMAVAASAMLSGNAIAQSSSSILMSSGQVILAYCLLHASGFFFGYILARMLRLDVSSSRTISIEVGMQNAALGVVLAAKNFGDPLTTVPCAVSSVCHSVFGSILAGIWRQLPAEMKD